MRRLIYDMYYAEEISIDIAIKLLDKLNEKIAKAVCDLFKEVPSNEEGEADNS